MIRISSWNFVCVPKAWLWAHIQSFSLKFWSQALFLQYTNFERIFWRARETLVKQPPGLSWASQAITETTYQIMLSWHALWQPRWWNMPNSCGVNQVDYHRNHIPNYVELACPLAASLMKHAKFVWGEPGGLSPKPHPKLCWAGMPFGSLVDETCQICVGWTRWIALINCSAMLLLMLWVRSRCRNMTTASRDLWPSCHNSFVQQTPVFPICCSWLCTA